MLGSRGACAHLHSLLLAHGHDNCARGMHKTCLVSAGICAPRLRPAGAAEAAATAESAELLAEASGPASLGCCCTVGILDWPSLLRASSTFSPGCSSAISLVLHSLTAASGSFGAASSVGAGASLAFTKVTISSAAWAGNSCESPGMLPQEMLGSHHAAITPASHGLDCLHEM